MDKDIRGLSRRSFIATSVAAGLGAGFALRAGAEDESDKNGLAVWDANPETSSSLVVADPSQIRILQVTDIHFFCQVLKPKTDKQTVEDLKRYVDQQKPDLVMVTGDLWHNNPNGKGADFMAFAIEQLESLGVPWLFTWGNHDRLDDYTKGHAALTQAKNSHYRGGPNSGCYTVSLTGKDGEPLWDIICLNSTDLGLQPQQQAWLKAEQARRAETPGAKHLFGAFHIPLKQYDDIWTGHEASGVKFENVCFEEEDGSSLASIKSLGVNACFVGHDHVNDYSGLVDGLDLVYGRATGHGGYGEDKVPKGAKLITANAETGQYQWVTVYPDGKTWLPEAGMHVDTYSDELWKS